MKKSDKPIIKKYFDVKIETMLPATIHYRILAEDAQEALTLIKGKPPAGVKYRLPGRKDLVIRVYNAGSTILQFIKRLVN